MSAKPAFWAAGSLTPAGPAARCSITANCQRGIVRPGENMPGAVPRVIP